MIGYAAYEEVNQRDAFLVFMELAGKSSLNKHLGTFYGQTFLKALPAFAAAAPSTPIYSIQGLDFVLGF